MRIGPDRGLDDRVASRIGCRTSIKRSRVRLLVGARLSSDSGQIVYTIVPLLPNRLIWYT